MDSTQLVSSQEAGSVEVPELTAAAKLQHLTLPQPGCLGLIGYALIAMLGVAAIIVGANVAAIGWLGESGVDFIVGGVVALLFACCLLGDRRNKCKEIHRLQDLVNSGSALVYNMPLSQSTVRKYRRSMLDKHGCMSCCGAFIVLCIPFPLYGLCAFFQYYGYYDTALVLFEVSGGIVLFVIVLWLGYLLYKMYLCDSIEQLILGYINADSVHDGKAFVVLGGRVTICENIGSDIFQFPLVAKAVEGSAPPGTKFIAKTQLVLEQPAEGTATRTCMSLYMARGTPGRTHQRGAQMPAPTREIPQISSQLNGEWKESWESSLDHFPVDDATAGFLIQWLSAEPQRSIFRFCGVATATADSINDSIEALQEELPSVEALGENCCEIQGAHVILTAHFSRHTQEHVNLSLLTMDGTEALTIQVSIHDTLADLLHHVGHLSQFDGKNVSVVLADGRSLLSMSGITTLATLLEPQEP